MKAVFVLLAAFSSVSLLSQTVTLTNTSDGTLGMDFVSGDGVNLSITGAARGGTVTLVETKNGSPYCPCPWTAGTTDPVTGDFTLSGTETDTNVAEYTEHWYVNGVAVGGLLDFEVVYKPASLRVVDVTTTGYPGACGVYSTEGIWVDITYQILNSSGLSVTSETGIPFEPEETVSFGGGPDQGPNDIGPVAGYSTSSQYSTDAGVFHDVPTGACAYFNFSTYIAQSIEIDIGDNAYPVRSQTLDIYGTGSYHGSITNYSDISDSH